MESTRAQLHGELKRRRSRDFAPLEFDFVNAERQLRLHTKAELGDLPSYLRVAAIGSAIDWAANGVLFLCASAFRSGFVIAARYQNLRAFARGDQLCLAIEPGTLPFANVEAT